MSWRVVVSVPEAKLFAILLQSTTFPSATRTVQEPTVLRVAGGWVRDKCLGKESHDIDIAINNQSGVNFATTLNEYLRSIGEEVRTLAVIQANPDQSKHLETANVRVLGFEVDCVNLRTETYTDESGRIPTMCIGTAQEDALRRDFTINALFYNLNTGAVEDLTGMGLADLAQGVVRTPIDPNVTFKDDPLRVLRALRFASRFNFALDSDLAQAASSPEVKAALIAKVSRERVYRECDGMFRGGGADAGRPYMAFVLLHRLGLLESVLPSSLMDVFPPVDAAFRELAAEASRNSDGERAGKQKKGKVAKIEKEEEEETEAQRLTRQHGEALRQAVQASWEDVSMGTLHWLHILSCMVQANQPTELVPDTAEETTTEAEAEAATATATATKTAPGNGRKRKHGLLRHIPWCLPLASSRSNGGSSNSGSISSSSSSSSGSVNRTTVFGWSGTEDGKAGSFCLSADALAKTDYSQFTPHYKTLIWAACAVGLAGPEGRLVVQEKKRTLLTPFPSVVLREGLKMETASVRTVQTLIDCMMRLKQLAESEQGGLERGGEGWRQYREEVGMVLRVCQDMWRECVLLACAYSLSLLRTAPNATPPEPAAGEAAQHPALRPVFFDAALDAQAAAEVFAVVQRFQRLQRDIEGGGGDEEREIEEEQQQGGMRSPYPPHRTPAATAALNLDEVWLMKPLLDGTRLIEAMGMARSQVGPLVGKLIDAQIRWQLREGVAAPSAGSGSAEPSEAEQRRTERLVEFLRTQLPQ